MKTQRIACLTIYESHILGKLFAYQDSILVAENLRGFCLPRQLGGERQSHHARTLRRLAARGLCEKAVLNGVDGRREVCAYRINEAGKLIWQLYCEHTGQKLIAVPAVSSLLLELR